MIMLLLKSQEELMQDTESRIIILTGAYTCGKTTALSVKALSSESSVILNNNFQLIENIDIEILKELSGEDFAITDDFKIQAKGSSILMSTYEDIIKHDLDNYDTALLDRCEFISNAMLLNTLTLFLKSKTHQIILAVDPMNLRQDSPIRDLAKIEKVIQCSVYDNNHLSESYINSLKEYTDAMDKCEWKKL